MKAPVIGYPKVKIKGATLQSRLEEYIFYSPDGCWYWIGSCRGNGYGTICFNYKHQSAHRAAYKIYKGPIKFGLHVLHKCDNPKCVNPDHLFLGTHQENMRDRDIKGRNVGQKGTDRYNSILTEEDVLWIRSVTSDPNIKIKRSAIRKKFGIGNTTLHNVIHRIKWKHL